MKILPSVMIISFEKRVFISKSYDELQIGMKKVNISNWCEECMYLPNPSGTDMTQGQFLSKAGLNWKFFF